MDWRGIFGKLFLRFFKKKKQLKLGIYGPPNAGKTTLANRICKDWLGEEQALGATSVIPHETREIKVKERVKIKNSRGHELQFNLVDTPGIATKIDFEDFLKFKLSKKEAKERAKEATKGVIEAIRWLEDMDAVVIVLDSTLNPISQVNITIIGNLAARDIPVIIAANKMDLKRADVRRVQAAFPQYPAVGISAEFGDNIQTFYEGMYKLLNKR
ncbi:50S ribosome-binding GTPase [archaeon]|nr:50S ribosome-binding GTPase [archaeon]